MPKSKGNKPQSRKDTHEWNRDMWETYLEMIEHPQMELLLEDATQIEKVDHEHALRKLWAFEPGLPFADAKTVIRALDELTHLEKQMVLLYFWEGKTVREIANFLERDRNWVWRRMRETLNEKLKKILRQTLHQVKGLNSFKKLNSTAPKNQDSETHSHI